MGEKGDIDVDLAIIGMEVNFEGKLVVAVVEGCGLGGDVDEGGFYDPAADGRVERGLKAANGDG